MIDSLLFKRYTIIDLVSQNTAIWLVIKYDNYWYFLAIIPFSMLTAILHSIKRVNSKIK